VSEVTLAIGGRSYKVACADGEEAHVTRLGAAIDAKLQSMPQLSGQDSQNLLFGALLLADELHELRNANTAAANGVEEAQAEAARHLKEVGRARTEIERLSAQLAGADDRQAVIDALRGELEELRQAEADMGVELHAAQAAEAELREQLAAGQGGAIGAAELAPALERFAELLESCADKLEGRAATP
jgi:cell division protein ZapA